MTKQAYKKAGVDLEASREVKRRIRDIVARTHGPEVLAGVGAFGALYSFAGYTDPVLVASTDPVGTKLKLAVMTWPVRGYRRGPGQRVRKRRYRVRSQATYCSWTTST